MNINIPFVAAIGDIQRVKVFTNITNANTIFDLASITKPLITLKYALQLYQPGDKVLGIDIIKLITHTSGIPQRLPWINWSIENYFYNVSKYAGKISGFTYSCHNYNLLAYYIFTKTGKFPLELFKWLSPGYLGMHPFKYTDQILPIIDRYTLIGVPHDGKARMLKEKAGNAGLFGNIQALLKVAQLILKGQWYNVSIENFYTPIVRGKQRYSLGWFLYSSQCKSCGINFSFKSFGHSGFPGSFVWFHPDNMTFQIFLSHAINHIKRKPERFNFLQTMASWLYRETLKD